MNKDKEINNIILYFTLACEEGNVPVLRNVLSNNPFDSIAPFEAAFPLHIAARNGKLEVLKVLIEWQFPLDIQNTSGQTPLFEAAFHGNDGIVKYLIKKGAQLNIADSRGWTPLMIAAKNNNLAVAKVLLHDGDADLDMVDKFGKRAIDKASSYEMIDLLRSVDTERFVLKYYNEPPLQKKSPAKNVSSQSQLNVSEVLSRDLENISRENFQNISDKLKEKFITHLQAVGLKAGETGLQRILEALDEKIQSYEGFLFEDGTKHLRQRYKKFTKEIEKYMELKLKIALNSPYPLHMEKHMLPSPEDKNLASEPTLDSNNYPKPQLGSPSSFDKLKKSGFMDSSRLESSQIIKFYGSPNSSKKKLGESMYEPFAAIEKSETYDGRFKKKTLAQDISYTSLDKRNVLTENHKSSPNLKKSQANISNNKEIMNFIVKQADRVIQSVNERTEEIFRTILEKQIEKARDEVYKKLEGLFQRGVVDFKNDIEETIVTTLRENMYAKRDQSGIITENSERRMNIDELITENSKTLPAPVGDLSSFEKKTIDKREEFIKKKFESHLENSLSNLSGIGASTSPKIIHQRSQEKFNILNISNYRPSPVTQSSQNEREPTSINDTSNRRTSRNTSNKGNSERASFKNDLAAKKLDEIKRINQHIAMEALKQTHDVSYRIGQSGTDPEIFSPLDSQELPTERKSRDGLYKEFSVGPKPIIESARSTYFETANFGPPANSVDDNDEPFRDGDPTKYYINLSKKGAGSQLNKSSYILNNRPVAPGNLVEPERIYYTLRGDPNHFNDNNLSKGSLGTEQSFEISNSQHTPQNELASVDHSKKSSLEYPPKPNNRALTPSRLAGIVKHASLN